MKLIDFGISKEMKIKDYTTTLVGTPHYIAPEIIMGKGYSFSSDYWSIGVCMFEIFYGFLPFGTNSKDVIEIYNEIIKR